MHNSTQIADAVQRVGADALVVKTEAAANLAGRHQGYRLLNPRGAFSESFS